MLVPDNLCIVQQNIGHQFRDKELLELALTAAGADERNHDGNRKLAWVGQAAIQLAVATTGFQDSATLEDMAELQKLFDGKSQHANAAEALGIVKCLKLCERSGLASQSVIRKAMRAILGAVWTDCGSMSTLMSVMQRFKPTCETRTALGETIVKPTDVMHNTDRSVFDVLPALKTSLGSSATPALPQHENSQQATLGLLATSIISDSFLSCLGTQMDAPDYSQQVLSHNATQASPARPTSRPRKKSAHADPSTLLRNYLCDKDETPVLHLGLSLHQMHKADDASLCHLIHNCGDVPLKLIFGVGSPNSFVALRAVLSTLRDGENSSVPIPGMPLTASGRFAAIEAADQQRTSLMLLRRLHVLKLWEEHCACVSDWLVQESPQHVLSRRPGNPQNLAKNASSRALLKLIYPALPSDSTEYRQVFEKIKKVQKLGRRLNRLKDMFGFGIMGFIQTSDNDLDGSVSTEISDTVLLAPKDEDFELLLYYLNSTHGYVLRDFSSALAPVLKCLEEGSLGGMGLLRLETMSAAEIARIPWGSAGLLQLLDCPPPIIGGDLRFIRYF